MLEELRHRDRPSHARDPSRGAAGVVVAVPPPPRDPRRLPQEPERHARDARPELSPASVVSIRVELRAREREAEPVRAVWRDAENAPNETHAQPQEAGSDTFEDARSALPRPEDEHPAASFERPSQQLMERAAAAYNFHRMQFDSLVAIQRPRLDVRA